MERRRYTTPRPNQSRRHKPDHVLVVLASLLLALGVILLVAISPAMIAQSNVSGGYYVWRQIVAMAIGLVLFFVVSKLDIRALKIIRLPLIIASLAAAALVLAISGVAFRWIQIGGLSFQPAELIKFTIVICGALFLSERISLRKHHDARETLVPLAIWMGVVGFVVVVLERDLGSMAVMAAIMLVMMLVANVPIKFIGLAIAAAVFLGGLAVVGQSYRRDRLSTFLNPEQDCMTTGYHACQALIAVGSGGVFGLGLGKSVQAYGYLPEASNDSIFAIYAEKFGFIGSMVLIGIYGLLFSRILAIMRRAPDHVSQLLAAGVLGWLASQTVINIGAMIGLLPLKGITLPLVSYGGTSLIFVLAALGLVYRISAYTVARRTLTRDYGELR